MAKLRHIGITVTDMEKSLELYRDYFGFDVTWDQIELGLFIDSLSDIKEVRVRTVKMKDTSGGMIELLQYLSHPKDNIENFESKITKIGCSHLALTVDDAEKTYLDLVEFGLKFNCEPLLSVDGSAKVCFCRDFDGTLMEIVEEIK